MEGGGWLSRRMTNGVVVDRLNEGWTLCHNCHPHLMKVDFLRPIWPDPAGDLNGVRRFHAAGQFFLTHLTLGTFISPFSGRSNFQGQFSFNRNPLTSPDMEVETTDH